MTVSHGIGTQVGDHNVQHIHVSTPPMSWPGRVGVVPRAADCFQERAVLTDVPVQVLSGLGGVGKTQAAARYAESRWSANAVDLLVWVTASSRESILTGYAETAAKVLGADESDPERATRRLLEWLASTDRAWLIVLDDLQNPGDLTGLWPPGGTSGQVVVTTRRRDRALSHTDRTFVELDVFTPAESLAYLTAALPGLTEGAAGLAEDLGQLPLALAQAAAYAADRELTCDEYRARLASRRSLTDVLPRPGELPDDHQDTVSATWSLSIDLADRFVPAGVARPMLTLASMLDPHGIPAGLFTTKAVLTHLGVGEDDAKDVLRCLHRLNLVTADRTEVRVHALVQRATRDALPGNDLIAVADVCGDGLKEAWPEVDHNTNLARSLRSNTDALLTNAGDSWWRSRIPPVVFRAGRSLTGAGSPTVSIAHLEQLCAIAVRTLGPEHRDTLTLRAGLAALHGQAGDPAAAVSALEQLLPLHTRVLGPDHLNVLNNRNSLAFWRGKAGFPATAVAAEFEQLLEDFRRVLGPDHRSTLITWRNLVVWQEKAGQPTDTVALFEQMVAARTRVLGPDHPDTLSARAELADQLGHSGDPAAALAASRAVLADGTRILGPDHPHVLINRHNLAIWLGEAGDPAAAVTAFEQLIPDEERIFGTDHPTTLTTRRKLAEWRPVGENPTTP